MIMYNPPAIGIYISGGRWGKFDLYQSDIWPQITKQHCLSNENLSG